MKKSVFSILVAGIFLAVPAGFALAHMTTEAHSFTYEIATDPYQMEQSRLGVYDPAFFEGSSHFEPWEYEGPVETGSLPPEGTAFYVHSGYFTDIPVFENGGLLYREGIDTQ